MAALMKALSSYSVGEVSLFGSPGFAILDRTGNPNVLVAISASPGSAVAGRWFVAPGRKLQEAVSDVSLSGADLGFPLSRAMEFLGLRGDCGFADMFADRYLRNHPETTVARRDITDAAKAWLNSGGINAVAKDVNQDAMSSLSCVTSFHQGVYEFYAGAGERAIFRHQAAASYPILAGEIAAKISVKMAVDRQKPSADPLTSVFGVDELGNPRLNHKLLRKLSGRKIRNGNMPLQSAVSILSQLPIDWFPKDDAEWDAFVDVADAFLRPLASETQLRIDTLVAGVGGKWVSFRDRLAKSYADTRLPDGLDEGQAKAWKPVPDTSREALQAASTALMDVIHAFRDLIILPTMASGFGATPFVSAELLRLGTEASARFLFDGVNLPKMLEAQRHWHTQIANIYAATGAEEEALILNEVEEDGWPALCDTLIAPNGLTILPLTNPRVIEDEGAHGPDRFGVEGLHHCVGGYSERCRAGTSHILSVRRVHSDGTFDRVTTVDIRDVSLDGMSFNVKQNYARGNTKAPKDASDAIDWFEEMVAYQQIQLNIDGVMTFLGARNIKHQDVGAFCGYDWKKEGSVERALEPWRPYLPKRAREISVDDLREQPEFADMQTNVAPKYRTMSTFA